MARGIFGVRLPATRWKKLKGYDKFDPVENKGQLQSSFKEFEKKLTKE